MIIERLIKRQKGLSLLYSPANTEVYTPVSLVREMLDKLPQKIWSNPDLKFCDPAVKSGMFLSEIMIRLMSGLEKFERNEQKRYIYIVENMIYGYSTSQLSYRIVKKLLILENSDIAHKLFSINFLEEKKDMKFDVIVGNPPWQEVVGPKKTKAIWGDFVKKSFSVLNSSGYLSLIHPPGWRNPGSSFKKIEQLIRSNDIKYLAMYSVEDGQKIFKVTSPFDVYVLKKEKTKSNITTLKLYDGSIIERNIGDMPFVPNGDFDRIKSLITDETEKSVNMVYSTIYHTQIESQMNKTKTDEFVHPCIRYVYANGEIDFWYSSLNKGHFGIPKVIMGFGADTGEIIIDTDGNYGMTQFTFGIVDEPENLPLIKKALDSDEFKNLMANCRFSRQMYNHRVISLFRKDFWKEFI